MPPCLVAIDFGTGAVRSVIFDLRGAQLASAYREIIYEEPPGGPPGAAEFSGRRMWGIIARAVRRSLAEAGVGPADVVAVSSTSQRMGAAIVDGAGRTLYAGPNRDVRGRAEADPARDAIAYEINGRWPMPIALPYRLKWFHRHQPALLGRASAVLMLNDWVSYQLSGEPAQAASGAAESLLLDIKTLQWSSTLLAHFGLPSSLFPRVVHGGEVIGKVTARAARATGLPEGAPVVAGGGDTQCALLACRGVSPGQVAVVAGTTAPVQAVTDSPALDPARRAWTGAHVLPGRWVHESNAGTAGILLRWFRDSFGAPLSRPSRPAPDAYDLLFGPAAAVPPGSEGLFAIMGPPAMDPARWSATRAFVYAPDQPRPFEAAVARAHFARALMENIAYAIKGHFDQLPVVGSGGVSQVAVCGGCARSPVFTQMLADVLARPMVMPRAREVAALGAAMCAAVGAGAYKSLYEAAEAMTVLNPAAEPQPPAVERYRGLYQKWRELNDAVRGCG